RDGRNAVRAQKKEHVEAGRAVGGTGWQSHSCLLLPRDVEFQIHKALVSLHGMSNGPRLDNGRAGGRRAGKPQAGFRAVVCLVRRLLDPGAGAAVEVRRIENLRARMNVLVLNRLSVWIVFAPAGAQNASIWQQNGSGVVASIFVLRRERCPLLGRRIPK